MPPEALITVLIARFDDLLGRGLRELIESDPRLQIVSDAVEYDRVGVVLRAHRPDVAILDTASLGKLAEVRELSAAHPGTKLILFASNHSMEECAQLLAFGASACLSRDTQARDVLSAIYLASRGLQVAPRATPAASGTSLAGGQLLTRREAELLPLLQQGRSNAEIALTLQVGVETVRTHARNIYRKLGVSSRRELSAPAPAPAEPPPVARDLPASPRRPATLLSRHRRGHGVHV